MPSSVIPRLQSLERVEDVLPAGKWKQAAAFVEVTSCVGAEQKILGKPEFGG